MKKYIKAISIVLCLMMLNGCVHTYWNESETRIPMENGTTNIVSTTRVGQYAFWTKSDLQNFSFVNQNRQIGVAKYSTKGDVELTEAVSKMITYAIAAYGSMGAYPTTLAIIEAFNSGEVDAVVKKVNNNETVTVEDFPVAKAALKAIKK